MESKMKKIITPVLISILCGLGTACSEGLSVDEYCDKIIECDPNAYSNKANCTTEINIEMNSATEECLDQVNAYYDCIINGVCNGNLNAKATCSRAELDSCKASLATN